MTAAPDPQPLAIMTERLATGTLLSRRFRLVLLHLAEEARRDLDRIKVSPARSTHSLRTRMKDLRAVLMLVKDRVPKGARKTIVALAKGLKDALSDERDAYVVAQLRAKLDGRHELTPGGGKASKPDAGTAVAKANMDRLLRHVAKLGLKGLSWEDVIAHYVACYREGRKAMKDCRRKPAATAFHKWRRPVKDLFYQSQVLQPIDGMKARRLRADQLSNRLGRLHDLQLVRASLKKASGGGLAKRIARKQKAIKTAIFKTAGKLFAERPRDVARQLERCVKFHPAIAAQSVRQT